MRDECDPVDLREVRADDTRTTKVVGDRRPGRGIGENASTSDLKGSTRVGGPEDHGSRIDIDRAVPLREVLDLYPAGPVDVVAVREQRVVVEERVCRRRHLGVAVDEEVRPGTREGDSAREPTLPVFPVRQGRSPDVTIGELGV